MSIPGNGFFVTFHLPMPFRIKVIPPCRTVLQPTCKPCHDRVVPQLALGIITDEVVLAIHRYKLYRLAQYLQCIVQLDAFADRHIRIDRTVQQQQRGLDFIRIEQGPVFCKQVGIIPRIAPGSGNGVIGIAPIALAPITGDVTDARMRNGSGEQIRLCLQVHRHETAVRRSDTTDTLIVDKRMSGAELLRSFDNFVSGTFPPRIDMAGGEFLTVTDSPTGLDNINHIIA